jgi:eukaryotic-like serine/threonine-protein kinase
VSGGDAMSEMGSILGTLPYMSPEQLEGRAVDARTDIFAFGLVLYQMLTGRRAFAADSNAGLIAATLTASPPPVSSLQPLATAALDRVVRMCLEKDPGDRWQSAHDLVAELRWIASGATTTGPIATVPRRRWVAPVLAAGVAVAAGVGGYLAGQGRQTTLRPPAIRSTVLLPAGSGPVWPTYPVPPALSPDGRRLAFVVSVGETAQLWVRSLDTLSAQPLAGTDGALYPFWSPDGEALAFFSMGSLRRIPVIGGSITTLCDAPVARGGSWSRDNVIVFASALGGIHRVSANGGTPTALTQLRREQGEAQHLWPQFLPDGRHFVFVAGSPQQPVDSDANAVFVGSLDGSTPHRLFYARDKGFRTWDRNVLYAAGNLLYRPQADLLAQKFDPSTLTLVGEPVPVAENAQTFSASDGVIAYQQGDPEERFQLQWVGRDGKALELLGSPANLGLGRLSPDGNTVAIERADARTGNVDIWLYDMRRVAWTRFTTGPARDRSPVFASDGRSIAFDSDRTGRFAIYRRTLGGSSDDELILDSPQGTSDFPGDFSPDGTVLALSRLTLAPRENWDVWILSLDGSRKVVPFASGEARQLEPRFSPDGRFLAYLSNETGRQELQLSAFPDRGVRTQVSTNGASWVMWQRDGRQIVYRDPRGRFFSVGVRVGHGGVSVDPPRPMLQEAAPFTRGHDLSPDGSRVLVSASAETVAPPVTLLLHWRSLIGE